MYQLTEWLELKFAANQSSLMVILP